MFGSTLRDWEGAWFLQYDLDKSGQAHGCSAPNGEQEEDSDFRSITGSHSTHRISAFHFESSDSRERFRKLRDEAEVPPTGEVDHLSAASDIAADTRPLLLTGNARLDGKGKNDILAKRQRKRNPTTLKMKENIRRSLPDGKTCAPPV